MNPFEGILLQFTEAASAEFLQAFFGLLAKKLNPAPPAAAVAAQVAPVAPAPSGILGGLAGSSGSGFQLGSSSVSMSGHTT